jgi:ABC-2 type transport system permease protein
VVELARIYRRLIGSRISSQVSYRTSFLLQVIGTFLMTFVDFATVLVIFSHLHAIAGWSLAQVGFLYGTAYICSKVGDVAVGQTERLPEYIRMGQLDTMLVRPLPALFQVVTSEFYLHHIGSTAQAAAVLAVSIARAHIQWTPARALVFAGMFVSGSAIFIGIWIASNAIAFWLVDAREVANSVTYGGSALAEYPLNIYGAWLRRLLAFVVPLAFINYFPALFVLGKRDPLGFPVALQFMPPVVAVATLVVAGAVWRTALRRYRSTGS